MTIETDEDERQAKLTRLNDLFAEIVRNLIIGSTNDEPHNQKLQTHGDTRQHRP